MNLLNSFRLDGREVPFTQGQTIMDAAMAAEVIGIVEPRIVIPMHYRMEGTPEHLDSLDRFLKEMGVPAPEPVSVLRITKAQLPQETQVMVMEVK
jgi:L-ascorbate metabolism protein UlaG (beta-lactamase superfamily)